MRPHAPVILNETRGDPVAEIIAGDAKLDGSGLRQAEEKIRKVVARAGHGKTVVEIAGAVTGKAEVAARIGVDLRIHLHAAQFASHVDIVLSMVPDQSLAGAYRLGAGKRGERVA